MGAKPCVRLVNVSALWVVLVSEVPGKNVPLTFLRLSCNFIKDDVDFQLVEKQSMVDDGESSNFITLASSDSSAEEEDDEEGKIITIIPKLKPNITSILGYSRT